VAEPVVRASLGKLVFLGTLVPRVSLDLKASWELQDLKDRLDKLETKVHEGPVDKQVLLESEVCQA